MATDVATALDIDGENMVPARWAEWIQAACAFRTITPFATPSGSVRIPHVIVLALCQGAQAPTQFSARAVWARDGAAASTPASRCGPTEGNIDHVLPVHAAQTSWENWQSGTQGALTAGHLPPEAVSLRLFTLLARPDASSPTTSCRRVNGAGRGQCCLQWAAATRRCTGSGRHPAPRRLWH